MEYVIFSDQKLRECENNVSNQCHAIFLTFCHSPSPSNVGQTRHQRYKLRLREYCTRENAEKLDQMDPNFCSL